MAVSTEHNHLIDNLKVEMHDFDPDGTDDTDISWVDMKDYGSFLVGFFRTVGTDNLSTFNIIANDQSDGSGTDVTVKSKTISSQPDAVGDYIWLEVSAEEVKQAGVDNDVDVRYVSAQLAFATATDEGVVTYIRGEPRFAQNGLTVDSVA